MQVTLSGKIQSLKDFSISVESAKLEYLKREKRGKLELAKITDFNTEELARLIYSKLHSNYIYNLSFLEEHNVIKFNIQFDVEVKGFDFPVELLAALEYQPENLSLRLITLF